MPWRPRSLTSVRTEFVQLAGQAGMSFSEPCWRLGIRRKTRYKWLGRYRHAGVAGLADCPRRPHQLHRQLAPATEAVIVHLRYRRPETALAGTRAPDRPRAGLQDHHHPLAPTWADRPR